MTNTTFGSQVLGGTADAGVAREGSTTPRNVQYAIVDESFPSDSDILRGIFPRSSSWPVTLLERVASGGDTEILLETERVFE